jgi:hypothetical protein
LKHIAYDDPLEVDLPDPKPTVVWCRPIGPTYRVACAIHFTIKVDEHLWIMVPTSIEQASQTKEIVLRLESGEEVVFDLDDRP